MVAKDEDLSSHDDGEEATPPTPPKPVSQEPSPVVRRDKQAKPLKSAKEVELTESEEEEEEKEEEQTVPRSSKKEKQKDLQLFWGKETTRDGPEEVVSKPKSGGLLLEWRVPEPEVKREKGESGEVGEGRKERRKRSSKKGSSRRKKEAAASNGATTAPTASDPFGVGSLEAWLDSEVSWPHTHSYTHTHPHKLAHCRTFSSPRRCREGREGGRGRRWERMWVDRRAPLTTTRGPRNTERGHPQLTAGARNTRRNTSQGTRQRKQT